MIYFVTVNYYSTELIRQLFSSFPIDSLIPYKLIIINNSLSDRSIYQLECDLIQILEPSENLGFGAACNLALQLIYQQSSKSIVWLINPDTYLIEKQFEKIIHLFTKYPEISIAGTMVYTEDGKILSCGGSFNSQTGTIQSTHSFPNNFNLDYVSTQWVSGCSLILNLANFQTCPQFDPDYFLYYEDFDFCRRYSDQGHLVVVFPNLSIIHRPSSITNRNIYNKLKSSTYSYLITLEKYTHPLVVLLRLSRILLAAMIWLPIQPPMAFGKLSGIFLYLKTYYLNRCLTSSDTRSPVK